MRVRRLEPPDPLGSDLVRHLRESGHDRFTLDDAQRPLAGVHVLVAEDAGRVVGSLGLRLQPIVAPETDWSRKEERDPRLADANGRPLTETFVQAFFVEKGWRRRGIGRRLQEAGLALTRELGACQMRSWSSLDRPANYRLKRSMGFAMHPATQTSWAGQPVSGVYFVKRVDVMPADGH